jgi:Ca-activated chloride channel family protein
VSIYPFSVGSEANRELLDFLGYLNRGYNYHVAELANFRAQLVDYIATHSSLIINDLKYMAAGDVGKELYPKAIPHLYRRETLLIFGRFGPLDDELVLTLSGRDASGARRDLVFRRRYRDCLPAGPELPQQWAGQKILHLLAERTLTVEPQARVQLQREIRRVAAEHNVFVPY